MDNWNRKRFIDPNNITPANLTTLRRFVGARDIEDAINFTIASGVDVGKRDLTQVKRTYQFLTKIYNEKIYCDDLARAPRQHESASRTTSDRQPGRH